MLDKYSLQINNIVTDKVQEFSLRIKEIKEHSCTVIYPNDECEKIGYKDVYPVKVDFEQLQKVFSDVKEDYNIVTIFVGQLLFKYNTFKGVLTFVNNKTSLVTEDLHDVQNFISLLEKKWIKN